MEEVRDMQNFTTTQSPSPRVDAMPGAEPVPDWEEAKKLWGIAWGIHWIGFGVAFSALAVTSVAALARSHKKKGFGRKPLGVAINSLLLILGVSRAFYLFVDPYQSIQNGIQTPRWLAQLLYNIAFPCLTSAFWLIFLVFLQVVKLQLVAKRLQNAGFLVAVISLHFGIVLFAEIAGLFTPDLATHIVIACQLFFVVWGLLLSASFIYAGLKVIHRARIVKKHLQTQRRTTASKVAKITLGTSCLGLACSVLHLYSLICVYQFYRDTVQPPSPWMWWAFQTCFRLVEIAMACTIAYCIMQPSGDGDGGGTFRRKSTFQVKILSENSKAVEGII